MTRIGGPPAVAEGGVDVPALVDLRSLGSPRSALDLQVHPSIATGRRRARYVAVVANPAAETVEVRMSVLSEDGAVRGQVFPAVVELAAGGHRALDVDLRPRRPRLLGRELERTATVQARARRSAETIELEAGAAERGMGGLTRATEAVKREIVFVQKRALPAWALLFIAALLVAAAAAVTQLPDRVTVPRVEGAADVASAQRALSGAGLVLDPRLRARTDDSVRPGTILDQIPDPGAHADRGERVALLVAVSARRAVMPNVEGLTRERAAALVRSAGLSAGPLLPAGAPADGIVASQLPVAGRRVAAGTVVTLFVRPPKAGEAATGTSAAPTAPAAAGDATVPALDGRRAAEYAQAVGAAGLSPKVIRAVDAAPLGTLVAVRPGPGTVLAAGATVRLVVAAGVPRLAFDTGSVMRLFDPRNGRTVREASPPQGSAVEPSWTADGRRVLYRVGRRLLLTSAASSARGRVVYAGRTRFASATVAPTLTAGVVAMVRRSGADGDLCFARLATGDLRPRCARDPRWDLGRAISWRPDGRELLVFGVRRGRPGTFGILRYRSARPFSANPRDWRGAIATDTSQRGRGVIAAAFSPSSADVGLVTNVGLERFQVLVTPAGDMRDPSTRPLPVRACELAWRPDGNELAVVQSDDACSRPLGELVRVDPERPRQTVTVTGGGRHPAYQPLTYAGPKGLS